VVLNAILAILITHKLIIARRDVPHYNNQLKHVSRQYRTTIGIIVESASAWTVIGLVMITLRATNSRFEVAFTGLFAITTVRTIIFTTLSCIPSQP
jgi:hypothetical protein